MAKKKRRTSSSGFTLPTEMKSPSGHIGDYSILLHGEPKIGKTSLASCFPEVFFLEFEPGTKGLHRFSEEVSSWSDFQGWVTALDKDRSQFKTVVIDTADIAYKLCREHVCRKHGMEHPSDEGYGKGWDLVSTEFQKWMSKIQKTGRGVIFISHSQYKEVKSFDGTSRHKIMPTLSNSAAKVMIGMVDFIFYFYFGKGDRRRLQVEGTSDIEAGTRGEDGLHFKGITSIAMGANEKEAYANLIKGFKNQLKAEPVENTKRRTKKRRVKKGL